MKDLHRHMQICTDPWTSWRPMESRGDQWKSMATSRDQWGPMETMETIGDPQRPVETHGDLCIKTSETHGDLRRLMEISGDQWRPMETHGDKWRPMETSGDSWRPMETHKLHAVTIYNVIANLDPSYHYPKVHTTYRHTQVPAHIHTGRPKNAMTASRYD